MDHSEWAIPITPRSHDLLIAGSAWQSLRPQIRMRMDTGSQAPEIFMCRALPAPPHQPSYVEQQHQSAVGSLPPPSASAHAAGLPETLGNEGKADQRPCGAPSRSSLPWGGSITYRSEPPGGAAYWVGAGTWSPPHRSAAPEAPVLQTSFLPVGFPVSPCGPAGSSFEDQLWGKGRGRHDICPRTSH